MVIKRRKKLPGYAFFGKHIFTYDAVRLFGVDAKMVPTSVFYGDRYFGTYLCSFMTNKILSKVEISAYRNLEGQSAYGTSSESIRKLQTTDR